MISADRGEMLSLISDVRNTWRSSIAVISTSIDAKAKSMPPPPSFTSMIGLPESLRRVNQECDEVPPLVLSGRVRRSRKCHVRSDDAHSAARNGGTKPYGNASRDHPS